MTYVLNVWVSMNDVCYPVKNHTGRQCVVWLFRFRQCLDAVKEATT